MYKRIGKRNMYLAVFGIAFGLSIVIYNSLSFVQVKKQSEKAIQFCGIGNVESVTTGGFTCFQAE